MEKKITVSLDTWKKLEVLRRSSSRETMDETIDKILQICGPWLLIDHEVMDEVFKGNGLK